MTVSGIQGAMARVNQIMSSVPGAAAQPAPMQSATTADPAAFSRMLAQAKGAPAGTVPVAGAGGTAPVAPVGGGPLGQRVVQLAQAEIGRGESPKGSNDGPDIRRYRTANPGTGPGDPWCATWVSFIFKQAGAPINGDKGYAWVPDIEAMGRKEGRWVPAGQGPVGPGDIIIFDRNGDGTTDHVGIVESVRADGGLNTIEGNTGGNDVARRSYGKGEWAGTVRVG